MNFDKSVLINDRFYNIENQGDIFNKFLWEEVAQEDVLNLPGIYLVCDKQTNEIVYVGQSNKIGVRLYRHSNYNKDKHYIAVTFVAKKYYRDWLESIIIGFLKPRNNKSKGSMPGEYYISKAFANKRKKPTGDLIFPYYYNRKYPEEDPA